MKHIISIVLFVSLLAACSADNGKATADDLEYAAEHGRRAAQRALMEQPRSWAQENAIRAIRAKESQLRSCGLAECADTFAAEAEKILVDSLFCDSL